MEARKKIFEIVERSMTMAIAGGQPADVEALFDDLIAHEVVRDVVMTRTKLLDSRLLWTTTIYTEWHAHTGHGERAIESIFHAARQWSANLGLDRDAPRPKRPPRSS